MTDETRFTYLEHLLCDVVVCTFGEMSGTNIVSSTKMDTEVHVGWSLKTLVVGSNITVKHLVGSLVVVLVSFPALQHGLGAKVCV